MSPWHVSTLQRPSRPPLERASGFGLGVAACLRDCPALLLHLGCARELKQSYSGAVTFALAHRKISISCIVQIGAISVHTPIALAHMCLGWG